MDLLSGSIRKTYFSYLAAAFGSAMVSSIYTIVDMAVVGQYEGSMGPAALAVVAPVWNIIYSLGLLMGVGGSVLFSTIRGESRNGRESEDRLMYRSSEMFTASVIGAAVLALLSWGVVFFFEEPLLQAFGADDSLMPLALRYLEPVRFVVPSFLLVQMLAAFLRNDGNPGLATAGVVAGGIFNVFGDIFFVFGLNLGVYGAGLATAIGSVISLLVMASHFFSRKNTLRLVRVHHLFRTLIRICVTGFPTFFSDVAMGILTILFNRQIIRYFSNDALSIYGIIINISTLVQCFAYSIGQASQPLFSVNSGAGKGSRIKETLRYALMTSAAFGLIWTGICEGFPDGFVYVFMKPTEQILQMAPSIIRPYAVSFLLLPLNIFSTYYFQALMKPADAFTVSVGRGLVLSGILILILPALFGGSALWWSMPVTELVIFMYSALRMKRHTSLLLKDQ